MRERKVQATSRFINTCDETEQQAGGCICISAEDGGGERSGFMYRECGRIFCIVEISPNVPRSLISVVELEIGSVT